jgi:microcystin-dependent protein
MDNFLGEIRLFGGTFAPAGWALCNGATLDIASNDALFVLLGTTYGGDGIQTFALPDLRGRVPLHQGAVSTEPSVSYVIGQTGGTPSVTLTANDLPSHTHPLTIASATGTSADPTGNVIGAVASATLLYFDAAPGTALDPRMVGPAGNGVPHDNMQPYAVMNYIIATEGIFPSQG